jgi:hypothetical protein
MERFLRRIRAAGTSLGGEARRHAKTLEPLCEAGRTARSPHNTTQNMTSSCQISVMIFGNTGKIHQRRPLLLS